MKARIKWVEGAMFLGQSESGHSVVMDGPPEAGGRNLGVRPMEMVLMGVGGCTAFDVVSILKNVSLSSSGRVSGPTNLTISSSSASCWSSLRATALSSNQFGSNDDHHCFTAPAYRL